MEKCAQIKIPDLYHGIPLILAFIVKWFISEMRTGCSYSGLNPTIVKLISLLHFP